MPPFGSILGEPRRHFQSDQGSRYSLARRGSAAAVEQLARSYPEQQIGRERRRIEGGDHRRFECADILGLLGIGHRVRQYRFPRDGAEEFSGHERGETFDRPAFHHGPFRMGTRDADDRIALRVQAQRARATGFPRPASRPAHRDCAARSPEGSGRHATIREPRPPAPGWMQAAPGCRYIRPPPIPDGHPPCRKSRRAGHCRRRRHPDATAARPQSRACPPPSYLPGCGARPGRRRSGRRAKAGSCWCPNQPRRIQPCSFQALPIFTSVLTIRYPRPSPGNPAILHSTFRSTIGPATLRPKAPAPSFRNRRFREER